VALHGGADVAGTQAAVRDIAGQVAAENAD
jgi:hypothetical protein